MHAQFMCVTHFIYVCDATHSHPTAQNHCSVLQCVAVCCSVLQCVVVCCAVSQYVAVWCNLLQYIAVCCSLLQFVAVHYMSYMTQIPHLSWLKSLIFVKHFFLNACPSSLFLVTWCIYPVFHEVQIRGSFVDGYCSTVQGLLDWFEVDLGFRHGTLFVLNRALLIRCKDLLAMHRSFLVRFKALFCSV